MENNNLKGIAQGGDDGINHSPAAMAYIGDAVFELMVRTKNIKGHDLKAGKLHKKTVAIVNAASQAKMADILLPILTEEEAAIYKRGRNAAVNTMPKNAKLSEYIKATGFEAVFGYLYLENRTDRILELFRCAVDDNSLGIVQK